MSNRARLLTQAVGLVSLITLAACSDDGSSAQTTSTTTASASQWKLVGLGDGVMLEGQGDRTSFVDQFARRLEAADPGLTIDVTNLGNGPDTSGSVLGALQTDLVLQERIAAADIIVISVGGNDADPFASYPEGTCTPTTADACLQVYAPQFARNFEAIVSEIQTLRAGKPTALRLLSDFNPFIGLSDAPTPEFGVEFY